LLDSIIFGGFVKANGDRRDCFMGSAGVAILFGSTRIFAIIP